MQPKFAVDEAEFGWGDQSLARHFDVVELAVKIIVPECQKLTESRETRCEVVVLPEEGLEKARMVGHVVKNFGGGQAITLELSKKMPIVHAHPRG